MNLLVSEHMVHTNQLIGGALFLIVVGLLGIIIRIKSVKRLFNPTQPKPYFLDNDVSFMYPVTPQLIKISKPTVNVDPLTLDQKHKSTKVPYALDFVAEKEINIGKKEPTMSIEQSEENRWIRILNKGISSIKDELKTDGVARVAWHEKIYREVLCGLSYDLNNVNLKKLDQRAYILFIEYAQCLAQLKRQVNIRTIRKMVSSLRYSTVEVAQMIARMTAIKNNEMHSHPDLVEIPRFVLIMGLRSELNKIKTLAGEGDAYGTLPVDIIHDLKKLEETIDGFSKE